MKMFRMGLEGGKPAGAAGRAAGVVLQGQRHAAVGPGAPLVSPAFALDGGEEPEIAGIYLIGPDGTPCRLGFALANEFSDHVTERQNYLFLAHSKLRPASFGPEILLGELPEHVEGTSRIRRGGEVIWEKPFLSGEANMSHTIANLEHHHFKYALFRAARRRARAHVRHGDAVASPTGSRREPGDVFEIEAAAFGLPLANPLAVAEDPGVAAVGCSESAMVYADSLDVQLMYNAGTTQVPRTRSRDGSLTAAPAHDHARICPHDGGLQCRAQPAGLRRRGAAHGRGAAHRPRGRSGSRSTARWRTSSGPTGSGCRASGTAARRTCR